MYRDNRFLQKEYLKNLFPVLFSVLGGTINALIDSIFVSRMLGPDGLAAVNLSMPVYLVICTFGSLIAGGASVMSAQSAGSEKMTEAAKYYHAALSVCILSGIAITFAGCVFCSSISDLLSQGGSIKQYVYPYCLITIIGTLPAALIYLPLYYLQLEGKTHEITAAMFLMIGADILFDFLLMFVFKLGIYGAALASVISVLASCIYGFVQLEGGYSNYHFCLVMPEFQSLKEIMHYGTPAALGNFVDAARLLILNAVILYTKGQQAAAVWAVLNSLSELSISITSGVPRAAAPMTGAYFSARENSGLRILMRLQMKFGFMLSVLYAAALLATHRFLEVLFSSSESFWIPLLCLGSFVVLDLIPSVWSMFFHSTGKLLISNMLVIFRKLLFPVSAALFMITINRCFWLFLPLSEILTITAGLGLVGIASAKNRKSSRPLSKLLLLDDYLEREKKVLDFSIIPNAENICSASEQIMEFCAENNMKPRQTMQLELSIEELLTVIVQKKPNLNSVDLRAFALEGKTGIRIRCAGSRYNPFEQRHSGDDSMMGIDMLEKMAEAVSFTYTLGMNIINIMFCLEGG